MPPPAMTRGSDSARLSRGSQVRQIEKVQHVRVAQLVRQGRFDHVEAREGGYRFQAEQGNLSLPQDLLGIGQGANTRSAATSSIG